MSPLREQFGDIDIYLFDQLLKGRIRPGMRVFDAGCGGGRNLVYLLREGYEVCGLDPDSRAIAALQHAGDFRCEFVENSTFADQSADVAISSAVLHFARDDGHFDSMLRGTWRVLKPGGLFFCRLASSIGMKGQVQPLGGNRFALPDGSTRYLVDEAKLMRYSDELGGTLLDPLKTSLVQGQRAMTTWVLRRNSSPPARMMGM